MSLTLGCGLGERVSNNYYNLNLYPLIIYTEPNINSLGHRDRNKQYIFTRIYHHISVGF